MTEHAYRLRMSPVTRFLRVAVYVVCGGILAVWAVAPGEWWWRALCVVGLAVAVVALRQTVGAVVRVDGHALTLQPYWPHRRRLPWYRIDHAELVPGSWTVVVEMNSGQRFELPCVDDVDDLFERVEHRRRALDTT